MSLGALSDSDFTVTAQGVMGTLRCANPSCNAAIAQGHLIGMGVIRVLCCPVCQRGSEFENTPRGWTCKLLPKKAGLVPKGAKRVVE